MNPLASFVRLDKQTPVWGVNSFASCPIHAGEADHSAGKQMGLHIPVLSGLEFVLVLGLWLSVADQDVALTAPGAPPKERTA